MNVIYHHKVLLQTWLYWFSKQFLWYRKDRKPNIVPFNVKSVWSEEETGGKWLLYYDSFLPTTSSAYLMHFSYSSYPWMILVVLRSGAEQLHRLMWEVAAPTIASSSPPAASPREVSFVIIQRSCLTSSPTLIQRHSQPGQLLFWSIISDSSCLFICWYHVSEKVTTVKLLGSWLPSLLGCQISWGTKIEKRLRNSDSLQHPLTE